MRSWYRHNPLLSYEHAMRRITRLVLSLRAVGTRLPIHLLASGFRAAAYEAALEDLGVVTTPLDHLPVTSPSWASRHHVGTFSKLRVLWRSRSSRGACGSARHDAAEHRLHL